MKTDQRMKLVRQNSDESDDNYAVRLESIIKEIRDKLPIQNHHPLGGMPIIPMMSATAGGRQAAMLFWLKEDVTLRGNLSEANSLLKEVIDLLPPVVNPRQESDQIDLLERIERYIKITK